ncbi:DNA-3-methyladenine glycosylase 1-like isoform X2 [Magnolia sinica]|uniref:DNA-3-methyladenine glycosylase 1-like isoform X2 n=1 Tax=Magnolia sinica TaxID=86752 RepID=UPI002659693D|nr:DNA-3-methyladenine glycosylase 1-like isoform X2 [Magnolia sinica]
MGEQAAQSTITTTSAGAALPASSHHHHHHHHHQENPLPSSLPNPSSKIPFRPRKIRKLSSSSPLQRGGEEQVEQEDEENFKEKKKNNEKKKKKSLQTTSTTTTTRLPLSLPPPPPRTLSSEGEISLALRHLRTSDPHLARLIDIHDPPSFHNLHPPFHSLARSILYQQLAFKAAASIYSRFLSLCGGEAGVVPDSVLALTPQQLRQIGVSARKATYLHDLASKYRGGILSDSSIVAMDDKSLFSMLTMVKGIGAWSVHMFMIFSLHRPDVLPVGDLGVRKGVQLLYNLDQLPRPSQMEQLCDRWRPYRSVGSWYMWRLVEAKGSPAAVAAAASGQPQQQLLHPVVNGIANLECWNI